MKTNIIPAPEVAYILRRELGPVRAWDDCLADMRKDKTTVNGYILKPACRAQDGRAWRPMYLAGDVVEFIKAVRTVNPTATRHAPLQVKTTLLDPADHRHWKVRKLTTTTVAASHAPY